MNRLKVIVVTVAIFGLLVWGMFKFVDFRLSSFAGTEPTAAQFHSRLVTENVSSEFYLPSQARNVSYVLQPNIGRYFITASITEKDFLNWLSKHTETSVFEINGQRTVRWMDEKGKQTELDFFDGLESNLCGGKVIYCRDESRLFFWDVGG